ncbi:MAG: diguanylate cyclase [Clostridiaceae bacterium]
MNAKILIIDDSKLNVRLLADILEGEGYTVYYAYDGLSGVEKAHEVKPDVILSDIIMPGIDGFEVCRLIKCSYEIEDIPIIMITAKTGSMDIKKALGLGAFDYIKKPFDEVEVVARVQCAIRYKQHEDKLKEMAMKDGLTGLYNHSLLIELFEKEYDKQSREKGTLSFVMLDIDYFKKVNDTYGHIAGDEILRGVSSLIKDNLRNYDIAGRYGGEEFSVVLPNIYKENIFNRCDAIRKKVEETVFNLTDESIKITVSIGVCFKDSENNTSSGEMIRLADEALYVAKNEGRNNVKIVYCTSQE